MCGSLTVGSEVPLGNARETNGHEHPVLAAPTRVNPELQDNAPHQWQGLNRLLCRWDCLRRLPVTARGRISRPTVLLSALCFQGVASATREEPAQITKPSSARLTTTKNTQDSNSLPPCPLPQYFVYFCHQGKM